MFRYLDGSVDWLKPTPEGACYRAANDNRSSSEDDDDDDGDDDDGNKISTTTTTIDRSTFVGKRSTATYPSPATDSFARIQPFAKELSQLLKRWRGRQQRPRESSSERASAPRCTARSPPCSTSTHTAGARSCRCRRRRGGTARARSRSRNPRMTRPARRSSTGPAGPWQGPTGSRRTRRIFPCRCRR